MKKTKRINLGTAFERDLERIFDDYMIEGRARIEKVAPPSRSFGGGRTILLPNPWLDFAGVWTERGGQLIAIEAKHTEKDSLPVARHGGITLKQWQECISWEACGAACAVVWRYQDQVKVVTLPMVTDILRRTKRVSIKWCEVHAPLRCHEGIPDILSTMAAALPIRRKYEPCTSCLGSMIDPTGAWGVDESGPLDYCRTCYGSGKQLD